MLCESAQRYRALMVILQSHRTQNKILRCHPTVSAILRRHTKSCLLCFFNNPLLNSQNFLLVSALFFTCFAVLEESIQAGALLRPKNVISWPQVRVAHTRAHVGRRRKCTRHSMQLHSLVPRPFFCRGGKISLVYTSRMRKLFRKIPVK